MRRMLLATVTTALALGSSGVATARTLAGTGGMTTHHGARAAVAVTGAVTAEVAAGSSVDVQTGDRPAPPADRPTDAADRPADDHRDVRRETFAVDGAGRVTVAYTRTWVRLLGVEANDGWRYRVLERGPRQVRVAFTDGHTALLFWARIGREGLEHGVERREVGDHEIRTYEVRDAGTVAIAVTDHGLRLVGVRPAEGWRYRVLRGQPRIIEILFANRAQGRAIHFAAFLGPDGEVHTRIEERPTTTHQADGTSG